MYKMYNYFRQYNDNKEILDHKNFYRKFSNEREFGGSYQGIDHLVNSRFFDTFGHIVNGVLRSKPKRMIDIGCGNGVNLPIAKLFPEIEYYAIDYALKTLHAAHHDYLKINFQCNDAFQTSFKDKSFDFAIMQSLIMIYEKEEDHLGLLKEVSRILADEGILALVVWNESPGLKHSIKLSRFFGKLFGQKIPQDFNGMLFSKNDIKKIVSKSDMKIEEVVHTGTNMGFLQSMQFLNFSKYNRKFGSAEKQSLSKHPQNILQDIKNQAGRFNKFINFLYKISRLHPQWFSMYSIYFITKNH